MVPDLERTDDGKAAWLAAAARELDAAERGRQGITPLSRRPAGLTPADAWSIAAARDDLRARRGEVRTGFKLGWTSEVMRRSLGVSEPNFGSLWSYMDVEDEVLDLQRLIHPKAEPEFAFRAGATLAGPDVTAQDVATAGNWAVAVEVVDPRWDAWDFDWLDNTADGSSAAAYAVSDFRAVSVPPERLTLTMQAGDVERRGAGREAMGSPAEAVAYLVRELHDRGAALEPGMVVLTGGITAPVDLVPGLEIRVSCPELGTCRVHCV